MDSSSDGSFAWTDASNDTIDSESKITGDMAKRKAASESDSEKKYKKKLQEELFDKSNSVSSDEEQKQTTHKDKRRKLKDKCDSNHLKKKEIKREPESDLDSSTKKHKEINGHSHSESHDSYDESYLELKVKKERQPSHPHSPTKHKVKRQSSLSITDNEEALQATNKKSKRKSKDNSDTEIELENEKLNLLVKEEAEKAKKKKNKTKNKKYSTQAEDTESESLTEPSVVRTQSPVPLQPQTPNPANRSVSFSVESKSHKRKKSISERLQFEEDDVSDVECSKQSTESSKLRSFLKRNLNMKPATHLDAEAALSVDDDIWIVRCPRDVNIDAFTNKDITLEGKCKLKLNGQTYEGTVDEVRERMSILTSERDRFLIKNLSIKGCVNLRKRIPKSHIREDMMVNNDNATFIPLPETKCRHPLFGAHYKKAIKLSTSVAQRLCAPAPAPIEHAAKKHKKRGRKWLEDDSSISVPAEQELRPEAVASPAEDEEPTLSKKKKKKRKLSLEVDAAPPKTKRRKRDLESAEAWDSEKAIEENLFNF